MAVLKRKAIVKKKVAVKKLSSPTSRAIKKAYKMGGVEKLLKSEKQRKLAELISENIGNTKPLTMEQMMLAAGYSPSTARSRHTEIATPAKASDVVQDHVQRLKSIREKLLTKLEETMTEAKFGSIGFNLSVIDKSLSMAEGKPQQQGDIELTDEEQDALDEILIANE